MALPHKPPHCQPTSMAVSLARLAGAHVPPQEGWWLGNGLALSKNALLTSEWPSKDPPRSVFDVDHESGIHFDVSPMERDQKLRSLFFNCLRLGNCFDSTKRTKHHLKCPHAPQGHSGVPLHTIFPGFAYFSRNRPQLTTSKCTSLNSIPHPRLLEIRQI